MPILKTITAPTGATASFHKALRANFDFATQRAAIDVASWASEQDYLAGNGLVWMWPIDASPAALANVDAALAQIAPFDGGTVVTDEALSLDAVKLRQWARVKDARAAAMLAGFTWDGSKFDADAVSQGNIQGAVQLAVLANAAGQAFSIEWTLFDNTTRTLSASQMIAVGEALGAFVAGVYATGVTLRGRIESASTVATVEEVVWPTS